MPQNASIQSYLTLVPELHAAVTEHDVAMPLEMLTSREAVVMALMLQRSTNRETAGSLGISHRTVEFHRANIMHKTGAKNLADLMRLVYRPDGLAVDTD